MIFKLQIKIKISIIPRLKSVADQRLIDIDLRRGRTSRIDSSQWGRVLDDAAQTRRSSTPDDLHRYSDDHNRIFITLRLNLQRHIVEVIPSCIMSDHDGFDYVIRREVIDVIGVIGDIWWPWILFILFVIYSLDGYCGIDKVPKKEIIKPSYYELETLKHFYQIEEFWHDFWQ